MKLRTKILAGVGAAMLALGLSTGPAMAAPPAKPIAAETIYVDPSGVSGLPLTEAADDWSSGTGVKVVVAPCTGDNCIHLTIVDNPCSTGGVIVGLVGGCAYASADPGACQVDFNDDIVTGDPNLRLYVTKHEIGHCIYWFGGAGFIHLDSKRALMKDGLDGFPRDNQTKLTSEDRRFALKLFT